MYTILGRGIAVLLIQHILKTQIKRQMQCTREMVSSASARTTCTKAAGLKAGRYDDTRVTCRPAATIDDHDDDARAEARPLRRHGGYDERDWRLTGGSDDGILGERGEGWGCFESKGA
jgi:hypothetical protein